MKVKIWAPYPYEVVDLRGPKEGEKFLNDQREVEQAHFYHSAFYPILEPTIRPEDELVKLGMKGFFCDAGEEWAVEESPLKKKVYSSRKDIYSGDEKDFQQQVVLYVDCHGEEWDHFRPTQIQSEVEVLDPEGYRAIGYGRPLSGELYCVNPSAAILIGPAIFDALLLERAGEVPNFEQLGKKCRFSNDGSNWETGYLASAKLTAAGVMYRNLDNWYSFCEIYDED